MFCKSINIVYICTKFYVCMITTGKIILLSLLNVSSALSVGAQVTTLPLVEEGRTWHVASLCPIEEPKPGAEPMNFFRDLQGRPCIGSPYEYVLRGDTIIKGRNYKKLMRTDDSRFIAGLRQDGNQVYRFDGNGPEYPVFDFDLKPGDVISNPYGDLDRMCVKQVDTISIHGIKRKRLTMWTYSEDIEVMDHLADIWVEGVGCMNGPNFPFWWAAIGNQVLLLDCCQDGQQLITTNDIVANIINGITTATYFHHAPAIYNLHGHRLTGKPTKGVYIEDGRKMVGK